MDELHKKTVMFQPRRVLRWIFIGRLSLATAIFVAAAFMWDMAGGAKTLVATLVLVSSIAFTAGSAWYIYHAPRRIDRRFCYAQAIFDLAMVTAVVHVTDGAMSQFAALYILVTASASLLLPVGGGLLIATLGNILYFADALLSGEGALTGAVILQLAVFGLVALGTAYLSARLKEAGAEREELEARLELARLQAEDILRNIGSGIITLDAHFRLLYANPAAANMLGFDARAAMGKPVYDLLDATAPVLALALRRAVHSGEIVRRAEATIRARGRSFPIGLTTTTLESPQAEQGSSATAIFQDITGTKALETLRLRAGRLEAVAELSASLAHEIKNPLASIRSAVEQLAHAPWATDDERTLSSLIVRESDRLARLLSEFLDFARARVTRITQVDVAEVARDAARLASSHPDRTEGVRVTCATPEGALRIDGDSDLLHRAIFNITLNAVQATPAGGEVRIEVGPMPVGQPPAPDLPPSVIRERLDRDAVVVRIVDTGSGVPEGIRDRIFDPFFTTKSAGTGLGLPIAYRAIEAHRGVLVMDSGSRGTTFTIMLPASQPALRARTPVEPMTAVPELV